MTAIYEFEFHYKRCYLHVSNRQPGSAGARSRSELNFYGRVVVLYTVGPPMLHYDLMPILKEVNEMAMLWERNMGYADLPISEFLIKSLDQKGLGLPPEEHEVSFP